MCQFSNKMDNFEVFGPSLPRNGFRVGNWKTSESESSRYSVRQFSVNMENFGFFGTNLPKNEFWGRNFKNISPDSVSAPPRYLEHQFSVKMDNSEFFGQNFGKLPNYVQYFGSNNVEGVAESWVEAEMSWVEVDETRWRLKWAGWRWMELGGGGCTV